MITRRVFAALLLLLVSGCGGDTNETATGSPTPSITPSETESVRPPNQVDVDDSVFRPRTMTVAAGTKITWVQVGRYAHDVRSSTGLFNSHPNCQPKGDVPAYSQSTGCMKKGDVFTFTFTKPGMYNYYCSLHALPPTGDAPAGPMGGTITVT